MTIIIVGINGHDVYVRMPSGTVEDMLEDSNLVNDYFEEAANKSYLNKIDLTSTSDEESAKLNIGKFVVLSEVPNGIDKNDIVKFGWWKNRKIRIRGLINTLY